MLSIVKYPNKILRTPTKKVEVFDDELQFFSEEMFKIMYSSNGIGLAANQVGLDKKMFVMDCGDSPLVFINPEIVSTSDDKKCKMEEGCLSFPGFIVEVERPIDISVQFQDLKGNINYLNLDGIESRCAQHEIDHLNGITFLKYLSFYHRQKIEKGLKNAR